MNKPTYEELDKRVQEPGQIIARHSIKEAESNIPVDPGTQTMNYASNGQILDLASIIDVKAIQDLMNDFYSLTNIGVAILDLNGNVLVATGWQDICTKFHRVHPVTAKNCLESDIELSKGIEPGTFRIYRCKNKMVDMATPIMLGNQKVGNLHLGQFFFEDEPPDIEAFRTRSQRHGFDENGYIHALKKAPRWSREKVTTVMNFYTKLAHIISELGYKNFMLCQNVMDKNDLLNSLRDSEEKYRTLLKTTSEGCWILNPELQTIEINESLCKMLGYRQDEMLGKIPFDFVDDENRKIFIEQTSKISTKEHRSYEITLKTKKGDALHTFFNATTIKDKSGEVQGSFALITDVTEKKRMAELLRHSEKKYRSMMEAMEDPIYICSPDLCVEYMNPAMIKGVGYDATGKSCSQAIYGLDKKCPWCVHEKIQKGESVFTEILNPKDGHTYHVSHSPIFHADDSISKMTIFRDITQRKHLEEEREKLIKELQNALAEIKTLSGLLPICSYCKKIRDDKGYWNQIESYIHKHSDTEFSHGICPECAKKYYPDIDIYADNGEVTED